MSTKRKLPQKIAQPKLNQSAKATSKGALDESRTVVSARADAKTLKAQVNGVKDVVEISSDGRSENDEDEDEEEDEESGEEEENENGLINGAEEADLTMEDAEASIPQETVENGELSLGELVRANAEEPIDVAAAFEEESSSRSLYPQSKQIQHPSGASLGTVLAQALRTNDVAWLESCLQITDTNSIRATIQRLESPLAGILLQKLAERLHRRPGRAGSLMVWVQWTLIMHGGYLATQRELIKKLSELNRVIDERAKGLPSLLSLKGKLDMLDAQMELRRSMQNQRLRMDEDEEDEGIIYVEGQESDEEVQNARPTRNGHLDEGSEVSEDMPVTNGVIADSDDEGEGSSDDDLIDDEAEETDDDSGDEDEDDVDHDDQDIEEDESEDGDTAPPTKLQRLSGVLSRKR